MMNTSPSSNYSDPADSQLLMRYESQGGRYESQSGAIPFRRDRFAAIKEGAIGVLCVLFGLAVLLIHHSLSTGKRDFTLDQVAPPIYRDVTPVAPETKDATVPNNSWINSYTDDPETIQYFDSISSSSSSNHRDVTSRNLNQGQIQLLPNVQAAAIIFEFAPRVGQFTPEVTLEFYDKVVKNGNLWSAKKYNAALESMRFYNRAGNRINYADNQRNAGLEVGDGQYQHFWQSE
jgi:hypothetical protein